MERLQVNQCGSTAIEIVKNSTQVEALDLDYDDIEIIDVLKEFHNLVHLSLIGNNVSDLSALEGMKTLEELFLLDGNYNITSLKPLFGLKNLSKISMNLRTYKNISREDLEHFGADPDTTYPQGIIEVD